MTDDDRLAELFRDAASDAARAGARVRPRRRASPLPGGSPPGAAPRVIGGGARAVRGGRGGRGGGAAGHAGRPPRPRRRRAARPAEATGPRRPRPRRRSGAPRRRSDAAGAGGGAGGGAAERRGAAAGRAGAAAPAPRWARAPGDCADRQDPRCGPAWSRCCPRCRRARPRPAPTECLPGARALRHARGAGRRRAGLLGVSYLPPGHGARSLPPGAVSAPTASGGTVVVLAGAPAGRGSAPAPFADRSTRVARLALASAPRASDRRLGASRENGARGHGEGRAAAAGAGDRRGRRAAALRRVRRRPAPGRRRAGRAAARVHHLLLRLAGRPGHRGRRAHRPGRAGRGPPAARRARRRRRRRPASRPSWCWTCCSARSRATAGWTRCCCATSGWSAPGGGPTWRR